VKVFTHGESAMNCLASSSFHSEICFDFHVGSAGGGGVASVGRLAGEELCASTASAHNATPQIP
jgi:hypothetical protein